MSRKVKVNQNKDRFRLITPDFLEENEREERKMREEVEVREVRGGKKERKGRKESQRSQQSRVTAQNIASVQVKIPNIRLPKSFLEVSPSVDSELEGVDDIASENAKLKAQNKVLQKKIEDLEETNKILIDINEAFGIENDHLNEKLDRYKSIRQPRNMQQNEDRPCKRRKKTKKSKRSIKSNYDSSSDESSGSTQVDARVSEADEKRARMEMKVILKTIPAECDLDYNETFTSQKNLELRGKLIPELIKSLKPNYNPSHEQITKWLKSLHRSRRLRINYKNKGRIDDDDRRLHANGRLNDKKIRRIKGARALYATKNPEIIRYSQDELISILRDNRFHSPEQSETDEENPSGKRLVCVYDRTWRSEELKNLLRNVLDPHSLTLQTAQLSRSRVYNDDLQHYDLPPPPDAPNWTCVEQNDDEACNYDTDME